MEMFISEFSLSRSFAVALTSDGDEEKSVEEAKEYLHEKYLNSESGQFEKEIKEMMERTPDLLTFGLKEVKTHLELQTLQKVFVLKKALTPEMEKVLETSCATVVTMPHSSTLESFGGYVGVKWFEF
jgi:stalled ribosome rescue protein Dom34